VAARAGDHGAALSVQHWLKVLHRFSGAAQRDVGDPHRLGPLGQPLMRPSFAPGDRLLVYVAGTHRCPGILRVTDDPWFDPERERWGWRTPVALDAACPLAAAPTLLDAGLPPRAVGRQARLRLRPEQFAQAERVLLAAARRTSSTRS
jgi:hypothetical protein